MRQSPPDERNTNGSAWRAPAGIARAAGLALLCFSAWGADRTIDQFVHKAWTGKDGAPGNVAAITQTADGYLWLASGQGLYRFDGVEFERFEPAGQPFVAGAVYSLLACRNGDLWVGSAVSGISLVRNGVNRNYTATDGFPTRAVLSIAQDRDGTILAATRSGIFRFDGIRWKNIGPESGFAGEAMSLYLDSHGTLWVTTVKSIFYLPPGETKFRPTGLQENYVMQLRESATGILWMAQTIRSVRPVPPVTQVPSGKAPEIVIGSPQILFDGDGSLWITSVGDGLRRVAHPDRLPNERLTKDSPGIEAFTAKDGLSADYVTSIYRDREGNIWLGTAGGVDRFARGAVAPARVPGKFVFIAMAPAEGGDVLLGGLSGGIARVHNSRWLEELPAPATFSVARAPDGAIWWVDTMGVRRQTQGRFVRFDFPNPGFDPVRIAFDRSGAPWVVGHFGIRVRRGSEWKAIDVPAGFLNRTPSLAYLDATGRMWFGYQDNAILLIDPSGNGSVERVLSANDGLQAGAVMSVCSGGSGAWIAGSKGLQWFDGQRFRDIAPAGGESFGSVSGVLETSDGSLWLNAYRGIVRISQASVSKVKAGAGSAEFAMFDSYDGLAGATQQRQPYPTLIQATDGKLWFATSAGPVWVDPNDLPRNPLPPPIAIRFLTSQGKRYGSFANLRLPKETRDLEIAYTAFSLTVPERVRFRYRLDGSDSDWRDAGTRRQAFYTNLGPGEYRFRVTASNNDGVWNQAGAAATFHIDAAYYQTAWFQVASCAAALALFGLLYRYRLQQATARVRSRLEGQIEERERIARELHDTLLQSFHGLMLRLQVVHKLLPEGRAKEQLEETLERADRAIAEGRSAVYDLRSSALAANDLSEALREVGNDLSNENTATFGLVVEGPTRELQPIIRDEFYRVSREALRNAFTHAGARHVEAEISYGERLFRLRIRDDGEGIPAEILEHGRPGHYGLPGIRERARQVGADLRIWSRSGTGTEIELSLAGSIAYGTSPRQSRFQLFRNKVG